MAENNITIGIGVNDNASPTIGEIKEQIKQLTKEIEKTTAGTKEYNEKLKQLSKLKGELKDLRDAVRQLDPSDRAKLFTTTFQSITGAVQGLTGAMHLLGGENQKLVQIATAMQGALNLMQAVQSVSELQKGMSMLNVIMNANPIFLVVGVIGTIGAALYALKDKVKVIQDMFDAIGDAMTDILDFIGIIDKEKEKSIKLDEEKIEKLNNEYDQLEKNARRRIALLKAQGVVQEEIDKAEMDALMQKRKILEEQIKTQENLIKNGKEVNLKELQDLKDKLEDINNEIKIKEIENTKEVERAQEELRKKRIRKAKEWAEKQINIINDTYNKEINMLEKKYKFEIDLMKIQGASKEEIRAKEDELLNKKIELEKKRLVELEKIKDDGAKREIEKTKELLEDLQRQKMLAAAQELADKEQLEREKVRMAIDAALREQAEVYNIKKGKIENEYNFNKQFIELTILDEEEKQRKLFELEFERLEKTKELNSNRLIELENDIIASNEKIKKLQEQGRTDELEAELRKNEELKNQKANLVETIEQLSRQETLIILKKNKFEIDMEKKKQQEKIQLALSVTSQLSALSTNLFTVMENLSKKDKESQKKLARAKFNIDKALRLAQATLDGARAVTANLANPIMAAIVGAMAATQIAAIASTQYKEPSDSGDGALASTPAIPFTSEASMPVAELPTQSQELTPTFVSTEDAQMTQPQTGQKNIAIIVESEIEDVNKRLTYIQKQRNYN